MNVPLPPTDNLYKFQAIAGLIVTLLSFTIPQILIFELDTQILKLNSEIVVLEEDRLAFMESDMKTIMGIGEEIELLQHEVGVAEAKGKGAAIKGLVKQSEKLRIASEADLLRHRVDVKLFRHRIAEAKGKLAGIQGLAEQKEKLRWFFIIGSGIGAFLMFTGFQLWYVKVQKYQDRILKNDAAKHLRYRSIWTRQKRRAG